MERTQLGGRPPLSPPVREPQGATLAIDQATRANLELVRTLAGERRGSLLAAIDRSVTAAGSRLLAQRLAAPLTDPEAIARPARRGRILRYRRGRARRHARAPRRRRPISPARWRGSWSAAAGRATSPPSATASLAAAGLAAALEERPDLAAELAQAARALRRPDAAIAAELTAALADELPHLKRDGGFVRAGYDGALDDARALRDESRRVIAALQARYADTTAVRALKIRHNNVLGYFVEVTAQHGDKLMAPPLNATFIHRQTLAGQVRFTTTELGELEAKIASAADRALGIELETFERLAAAVTAAAAAIKEAAEALAILDVAAALGRARGRAPLRAAGDRRLARFHHRGRTASGGGAGARRRRRAVRRQRLRSLAAALRPRPAASICSPARTWRANRPICARTR